MFSLSTHLDLLTKTVNDVHRLPHVLADLAYLPPGGHDQDEAQALARTLDALNIQRDGSSTDPTFNPAAALEESLRTSAQPAAQAFRKVGHSLLARLDRLAAQGVRPPDAIVPQDFGGKIDFLKNDDHNLPLSAWGHYDALDQDHPIRAKLKREDAYEWEGKALVYLGPAITGDFGSKPLAWLPIGAAIRGTLHLSTPQRKSRQERADREKADQEKRQEAWEATKSPHERNLAAKLAEALKEITELKSRQTAGVA
jgi:hypothetical protein